MSASTPHTARRARLIQPLGRLGPEVEVLWTFRRWRVHFCVVRFADGEVDAFECAALAHC